MPNLTDKTLAQLRTMTPAEIRTAQAAYFDSLSKKQLIEWELDATEFTDKPEVTTGEHGDISRTQTVRDALGAVIRTEAMEWTYFSMGEVDEIIKVVTNAAGDEINDGLIQHSLTAQPVGRSVLTIVLAPRDTSGISTPFPAEYWKLADMGSQASLWCVDAPASVLLALHEELWVMNPTGTFGVLAVASARGNWFLKTAVRHHAGMSGKEALARRDRIADYLDSLGKKTTELRAAKNEAEQMAGVVSALGFKMSQLWRVMRR